jgi:hypothetical protein
MSPFPYVALMQATTRLHPQRMLKAARLLRRGMA